MKGKIRVFRNQSLRDAEVLFQIDNKFLIWYRMPAGAFYMNVLEDLSYPDRYKAISFAELDRRIGKQALFLQDEMRLEIIEAIESHIEELEYECDQIENKSFTPGQKMRDRKHNINDLKRELIGWKTFTVTNKKETNG
jgi:hypothetical protein